MIRLFSPLTGVLYRQSTFSITVGEEDQQWQKIIGSLLRMGS